MSRIAGSACGGSKDDPRNFFPWGDNGTAWPATTYPGSPDFTFDEWFELAWRIQVLAVTATYTDGGGTPWSKSITCLLWGSNTDGVQNDNPVPDETFIRCQAGSTGLSVSVQPNPTVPASTMTFTMNLFASAFNSGTGLFSTNMDGTSPGLGDPPITTFLGKLLPVAGASGPHALTLSAYTWWGYDNGSGPIWDTATGAQLITPVPRGL